MGRTDRKTDQKKQKQSHHLFVQLHERPFSLQPFLALLRDMMVSYIYVRLFLFVDAYRKEDGAKAEEEEQRRVGEEMMRNTPCYIPPDSLIVARHLCHCLIAVCMQRQQPLVVLDHSRVCNKEQ